MSSPAPHEALDRRPWWSHMNRYHWYVFVLAAMGWLFDTMDQQIFVLSRSITMKDLLPDASFNEQNLAGSKATMAFVFGWATGGLVFGAVGDRWGRAKTMALTILIYALFTGLSGLARTPFEFGVYRFLTGLGVGGEFAAGAALVAEVMPAKSRVQALGFLQALSTVGNVSGAMLFGLIEPMWGWRGLYFVGAFPALLAVVVRFGMKEPETWVAAKKAAAEASARGEKVRFGSYMELFTHPKWRKHTLIGLALAVSGVFCLWGIAFYATELIESNYPVVPPEHREKIVAVLEAPDDAAHKKAVETLTDDERKSFITVVRRSVPPKTKFDEAAAKVARLSDVHETRFKDLMQHVKTSKELTALKMRGSILQNCGAFFGIYAFGLVASRLGRRPAFLIAFLTAWVSLLLTFGLFTHESQMWYLWPIMGFGTLAPFGGYAVYFPELYPTSLRTTGTGFCYNVGRYASGLAPLVVASLALSLEGMFDMPSFRVASMICTGAYLLGILVLIWAPETRDQALPEDEKVLAH